MQVEIITSHTSNRYHRLSSNKYGKVDEAPSYFYNMEVTEVSLTKAIAMGLDFCPVCFDKEPT